MLRDVREAHMLPLTEKLAEVGGEVWHSNDDAGPPEWQRLRQ